MTYKLLFVLSVSLIVKATFGKSDCEKPSYEICKSPSILDDIPREISTFNRLCVEIKTYMTCSKQYQDDCGIERLTFYRKLELFETSYNAIVELCEEGTLLNTVTTENLKCLSETFSKTNCRMDAIDVVRELTDPFEHASEFGFQPKCLGEALTTGCILRAFSESCGQLAEEAMLDFIVRSKALEYSCSEDDAQVILDGLDNLKLNEDQRTSIATLLRKVLD